jgi:hypothetical protein
MKIKKRKLEIALEHLQKAQKITELMDDKSIDDNITDAIEYLLGEIEQDGK